MGIGGPWHVTEVTVAATRWSRPSGLHEKTMKTWASAPAGPHLGRTGKEKAGPSTSLRSGRDDSLCLGYQIAHATAAHSPPARSNSSRRQSPAMSRLQPPSHRPAGPTHFHRAERIP